MDDLNLKTADELVRLHNAMCAEEDRIDGPWKKSKRTLIECIRALGNQATDDQAAEAAEGTGGRPKETIGAYVEAMLATEATYADIARTARERFEGARTTTRSVASVASALRRRGVLVTFRKKRLAP